MSAETLRTVVARGVEAAELGLEQGALEAGETLRLERPGEELVLVVFTGVVDVVADGAALGAAGGRRDPVAEPGHAVYAPPGAVLELTAGADGAAFALFGAAANEGDGGDGGGGGAADAPGPARIVAPADQEIVARGAGNGARVVRTMVGPGDAAARLIVGETINPPGNWSSYPPHKHDVHDPPHEARLEEIYFFRVAPPAGWGVQLQYDDAGADSARRIHDGDVSVIRSGYHPVVAAPGYELYYLWALAGEGRALVPRFEPAHAHLQEAR